MSRWGTVPTEVAVRLRCGRCDAPGAPYVERGAPRCAACKQALGGRVVRNPDLLRFVREARLVPERDPAGRTRGRPPRRYEWNGETRTLAAWTDRFGLSRQGMWKALGRLGRPLVLEVSDPEARRFVAEVRLKSPSVGSRPAVYAWRGEARPLYMWARRLGVTTRSLGERLRARGVRDVESGGAS